MYCTKCGAQIADTANFCEKCGTKIVTKASNENNTTHSNPTERIDLISSLKKAIPIYEELAKYQNEFNKWFMSLGSLQSKFTKHFASFSDGKFGTYHVIDCIVMFFCFFFGLSGEKGFFFWVLVCIGILYLLQKRRLFWESEIERMQRGMDNISSQARTYLAGHEIPELYVLPQDYRYLDAAKFILFYLENGRADNMKEACNLYEEELHRQKMENMQVDILNQQQFMINLLRNLNSKII